MSWNLESSGNIDFYISCTYYLLLAEDSLLLVDTELRIVNGLFCWPCTSITHYIVWINIKLVVRNYKLGQVSINRALLGSPNNSLYLALAPTKSSLLDQYIRSRISGAPKSHHPIKIIIFNWYNYWSHSRSHCLDDIRLLGFHGNALQLNYVSLRDYNIIQFIFPMCFINHYVNKRNIRISFLCQFLKNLDQSRQ